VVAFCSCCGKPVDAKATFCLSCGFSLVFSVRVLVISLMTLPSGVVALLFDLLILYYLTRPHVREYFDA